MIRVAPAILSQLARVPLAELVKDRRAAGPSPARHRVEAVGAIWLEARQVEKAQRPAPVDQHLLGSGLQGVTMQVPHVEIAAGIVKDSRREARGAQARGSAPTRDDPGPGAGATGIVRSERLFDVPGPPLQKALRVRGAVHPDHRLLDPARSLHLRARGFEPVARYVGRHPRHEQNAACRKGGLDRLQIAKDPD